MDGDILFYKRCAFGSSYITGRLDLIILRGSTNDDIIQNIIEEFFDLLFQMESSITVVQKEKELKDFEIIGWAGGSSILKVIIDTKGDTNLLTALQEEWPKLAYKLARRLDLALAFNPERTLRFAF